MHEQHAADDLPALPPGWRRLSAGDAAGLVQKLISGISGVHTFAGVEFSAIAARASCDGVLYRRRDVPLRFTIVHLTWSSKRETAPYFPSIEYEGTFAVFLTHEHRLDGHKAR